MRPASLLALGACAYAAFLLAGLPASVVAPRLQAATEGRIALERATGSLWNGTAALRLTLPSGTFFADQVRWRFLPSRLLAGKAAADVEVKAGKFSATAELARTPGAWEATGLRGSGDASVLALLAPVAGTWQPAGPVEIEAERLRLEGQALSGRASAQWAEAAVALSPLRPLGTWRAQLEGDGGPARVQLATVKGPLRLAGTGTLGADGRLAFAGEARAEAGREADLAPLLALFGPRRADGAHAIELR